MCADKWPMSSTSRRGAWHASPFTYLVIIEQLFGYHSVNMCSLVEDIACRVWGFCFWGVNSFFLTLTSKIFQQVWSRRVLRKLSRGTADSVAVWRCQRDINYAGKGNINTTAICTFNSHYRTNGRKINTEQILGWPAADVNWRCHSKHMIANGLS